MVLTVAIAVMPFFASINFVEAENTVLPYAGVGTDYCLYFCNSAMTVWTQYTWTADGMTFNGHVDLLNAWKPLFTTPKMGFTFPNVNQRCSYYDAGKWETLLKLFSARGVKVVAQFSPLLK